MCIGSELGRSGIGSSVGNVLSVPLRRRIVLGVARLPRIGVLYGTAGAGNTSCTHGDGSA